MPRRFALPCVYAAAALATAASTLAPLAMTPASGLAGQELADEPATPYILTARSRADARALLGEGRLRVRRYYTAALPGFATYLSATQAARLRADRRVRSLEPDRRVHVGDLFRPHHPHDAPEQRAAIREVSAPNSRTERDQSRGRGGRELPVGRGLTVYVVDGGVDVDHPSLGDRAWRAYDATGGGGQDCTGHGTRVARLVANRSDGVARQAGIASVRVLGCGDVGNLSDVIAGIDWVRRHAHGLSVTNLSIGTKSDALDTAVRRLVRSGVPVVANPRAAAEYLESHADASPSTLASWLKSTAARGAIRQNPNRTPHGGGQ